MIDTLPGEYEYSQSFRKISLEVKKKFPRGAQEFRKMSTVWSQKNVDGDTSNLEMTPPERGWNTLA